ASTVHQIACPPERQDARTTWCRSGLACPLNEANAARHSCGSCWWCKTYVGIRRVWPPAAAATSGQHPDFSIPRPWFMVFVEDMAGVGQRLVGRAGELGEAD